MTPRRIEILLVEDNPGDVILMRAALEASSFEHTLHVVRDGPSALDFVRGQGEYHDVPTPDLVLLDLGLPRLDGRSVLAEMRSDPDIGEIPVLVLTTSDSPADVQASYAGRANTFISKGAGVGGYASAVRHIERYWLAVTQAGHPG